MLRDVVANFNRSLNTGRRKLGLDLKAGVSSCDKTQV